jgi:predicted NBD/HSP70 family sugar kinase
VLKAMRGSNHNGMRQFNERIVLRAIRHAEAIPKADLARLTQLSTQTISIIVNRLLEDGLLIKQERIRGKIGQPSIPLSLNPDGAYSIGLQVGRRGLEVVVSDFLGQIRHTWQHYYPYPSPAEVVPKMAEGLAYMQSHLGEAWSRVVGIGLSAPLSLHAWGDLLGADASRAMADWESVDLRHTLQTMTDLPVEFAKDTTAACVAELVQGRGREHSHFLYIFMGTFVGGGLVLDGHIINGLRGNAGAIGSFPLNLGGNSTGQLLESASGWQLEQALINAGLDPLLVADDRIMETAFAQMREPWLARASHGLALCITSAAALLDLDSMVMDGSISPLLLQALMARTQTQMQHMRFEGIHMPTLVAGQVGRMARSLGAALLPLHAQFFPDKDIFLKQDLHPPLACH